MDESSRKATSPASALFFGLATCLGMSADAVAAEDFYKDKRITLLVSGTGAYEGYARIVAKHMGKHIPGNPTFIVKAMIGASGLQAANHIFNSAPKDGTEIAAVHGHIPTLPIYKDEGVRFDPLKLGWIGSVTKDTFVAYAWQTAKVKSMEEALAKEGIFGGQTVGAFSVDMPIIANAFAGTKFKIVTGYEGSAGARMAVEKGELDGVFGSAWNSIKNDRPEWFTEKKAVVFTQFGSSKHKELPDAPLFLDYVKDKDKRAATELYLARAETGKPYFAPPGMPPGRLEILRTAFDKTMRDPEFLADVEKQKYELSDPLSGAAVEAFIKRMAETPKSTVAMLDKAIADFTAGK
jgi:tripartite-type tricarboxylate transporter receptor subunit TctC